VLGLVEMLSGMLVLGGITASHFPADQAKTKMNPSVACFHALFAALGVWLDVLNLV
jgi:hypothetical protein